MKIKFKKLGSKGFSHLEAVISIVAVLAIGFIAYSVNTHHKPQSHAATPLTIVGLSTPPALTGFKIAGCQTLNPNKLTEAKVGSYYQVKLYFYKPASFADYSIFWRAEDLRGSPPNQTEKNSVSGITWLYHTVAGVTINISQVLNDQVFAGIGTYPPNIRNHNYLVSSFGGNSFSPSRLAKCS